MLAAGVHPVGGLGARAIYGDRELTARELNAAWMMQQKIIEVANDNEGGAGDPNGDDPNAAAGHGSGAANMRTRVSARRVMRLEREGKLSDDMDPDAQRPDWLPPGFDPGPV